MESILFLFCAEINERFPFAAINIFCFITDRFFDRFCDDTYNCQSLEISFEVKENYAKTCDDWISVVMSEFSRMKWLPTSLVPSRPSPDELCLHLNLTSILFSVCCSVLVFFIFFAPKARCYFIKWISQDNSGANKENEWRLPESGQ